MKIRQISFIEANRLKEELDKINTFLVDLYYMYLNDSVEEEEYNKVVKNLTKTEERITKQLKEFYENARNINRN